MSDQERIHRLENAMSTLAELSADLHRLTAGQQQRTSRVEESLLTVIKLVNSNTESIHELRAAQAESEHKLAALTDAMIRLADAQKELAGAQKELPGAQKQLAESQAHSDKRLDALIDIVREWRNGRGAE